MTEQPWAKEPWKFVKDSPDDGTLLDAEGNDLLHGDIVGAGFIDLHAGERAEACVNACARIPTEALEAWCNTIEFHSIQYADDILGYVVKLYVKEGFCDVTVYNKENDNA